MKLKSLKATALFILATGANLGFAADKEVKKADAQKRNIINVWIHGTTLTNVSSLIWPYNYAYCYAGNKFCYCSDKKKCSCGNQGKSDKGTLAHIKDLKTQATSDADLKKQNQQTYTQVELLENLTTKDAANFPNQSFYLFGWNGKLTDVARKEAAKRLHKQLVDLIEQRKQQTGKVPFIRIISHSHGGTIALKLTNYNKDQNKAYDIDELILLGCPNIKETAANIKNPMFKRIYSFYTPKDHLQPLSSDNRTWQPPYPTTFLHLNPVKTFEDVAGDMYTVAPFKQQMNLTQIKATNDGKSIGHGNFRKSAEFMDHLPTALTQISMRMKGTHSQTCSFDTKTDEITWPGPKTGMNIFEPVSRWLSWAGVAAVVVAAVKYRYQIKSAFSAIPWGSLKKLWSR